MPPFEQHLECLHVLGLVRVGVVAVREVFHELVGVVNGDAFSVSVLKVVPHEPVEPVDAVDSSFDGFERVAFDAVGVLPEVEKPLYHLLAVCLVVNDLPVVQAFTGFI